MMKKQHDKTTLGAVSLMIGGNALNIWNSLRALYLSAETDGWTF